MSNSHGDSYEEMVDTAIDAFLDYQRKSRRKVLVRRVGKSHLMRLLTKKLGYTVSNASFSQALQYYRTQQEGGGTKYVIAAVGYGRAAKWHILSGPGLDIDVDEVKRVEHTAWVVKDASAKVAKDVAKELLPQINQMTPDVQTLINDAATDIKDSLVKMVRDIKRNSDAWANLNSKTLSDVHAPLTDDEADVLSSI